MIAFATLFLGLILGPQEVELAVGSEVASVEVRLGGSTVGVLEGEPWKLNVDFGPELVPQRLVAIARDAEGQETGRVLQWINLPQPPAEVTVTLDGEATGRVARLAWESVAADEPETVEVSFDGAPLAVADPRQFELPPHDESQLHFLRVELDFPGHTSAVAEVTFGGTYLDQVSTELTAVPLLTGERGWKKTRLEDLPTPLFVEDDATLRTVALETEVAQVVLVVDPTILERLQEMAIHAYGGRASMGERIRRLRNQAQLPSKHFTRIVWPDSQPREGFRRSYNLFPTSPDFEGPSGGLFYLLYVAAQGSRGAEAPRLADAVAVAGLQAAGERRRRAVILILGDAAHVPDPSQLTAQQTRRYLERLRVPFDVWSLTGDAEVPGWGEVRDTSTLGKMGGAVRDLTARLKRQAIVWVDGVHLPQEIALTPAAEEAGLVLAR